MSEAYLETENIQHLVNGFIQLTNFAKNNFLDVC